MSAQESTSLQRLLRPRQAAALLESFAPLIPGLGLALVRADRRLLASAGHWPHESLGEMLSGEQTSACRTYPLFAGEQEIGTLVALGESSDVQRSTERVLHRTLATLLAQAIEKRDIASEALHGYRES